MGWVLLEAGVALLLAILIVWWVIRDQRSAISDPKKGRNETDAPDDDPDS